MSDEQDDDVERLRLALAEAQAVIADQKARLKSLGAGREESLLALATARDELKRVGRERDELRKQLTRIDDMQTSTVALPEDEEPPIAPATSATLPSIEDLIADLSSIRESGNGAEGHLHLKAAAPGDDDASEEMLSPALVFPEEYAKTDESARGMAPATRVLVLLDGSQPIKYPLYQSEMTIGRVEAADICIDSHFISRLHARLVATSVGTKIEDIESKNGIKVNGKLTQSQELKHGDLISLGGLRFRFLDLAAEAG
jgi:uncharacterized coiled-coil protein SlyX